MPQRHFVKNLRTNMTDAERLLWSHLRAHRLGGEKFRRQQPIGSYTVDFVHFGARLIVEADGSQHNESVSDPERDAWLASQGFRVLRFWNHEILGNVEAVLETILVEVGKRSSAPSPPTPPPRRGEGSKTSVSITTALHSLPAGKLAVGYSGGLDSTVLLHALAASPDARAQGLRALHMHHGLHPDADVWAAHCEQVCGELDVPLQVLRVRVDHAAGRGPEGAARAARLQAFRMALDHDEILVLAHHRDDQAETVLLRLMRGAGGDGLGAMRRRSRLGALHLWRPLLDLPRAALRDYATNNALRWIEDPSNTDARYDRNYLRHRVLPVLAERWPQAMRNLARSAALLAEQSQLLAIATATQLDALLIAPDAISLPGLLAQPSAQRARLLRMWLARLELPAPTFSIIAAIELDLLPARDDGDARVAWADVVIHRWRDQLHAERQRIPLAADWIGSWDGLAALTLPDGSRLELCGIDPADSPGFDVPLTVRARHGGERIHLPGRKHTHTLKHVLQDRDVPPWLRARIPLLFDDDGELLAAGDSVLSARMGAWLRARGAHLRWLPDGGDTTD